MCNQPAQYQLMFLNANDTSVQVCSTYWCSRMFPLHNLNQNNIFSLRNTPQLLYFLRYLSNNLSQRFRLFKSCAVKKSVIWRYLALRFRWVFSDMFETDISAVKLQTGTKRYHLLPSDLLPFTYLGYKSSNGLLTDINDAADLVTYEDQLRHHGRKIIGDVISVWFCPFIYHIFIPIRALSQKYIINMHTNLMLDNLIC